MSGHIVERGPNRWGIVLEIRDATGKRKQKWSAFRGSKRDAQKRLAELITEREHGTYVEPSKQTVAKYFEEWLRDCAPITAGPRTVEGYGLFVRYITEVLGDRQIQQVRGNDLNRLYLDLRARGLSPRTVKHTHVLARRVFGHALRQGDIKVDPSTKIDAPKAPHQEAAVLRPEEIPVMLDGLRGTSFYPIAVVALGTGLRRGELCALRWQDVDLEGAKLEVKRSLEQTRAGLRFKEPKSARGRRTISLSPSVVACLKEHYRGQLELRMKLGQGKPPQDALVFPNHYTGGPRSANNLSGKFVEAMQAIGLPHVSLHSLRHTHASMLIKAGEDILTISRRLGHSNAAITLGVYGHLMSSRDRAADIVEEMLNIR
jgi:integrase